MFSLIGPVSHLLLIGLVDGRDLIVIAANLQKLLDDPSPNKNVTFALVTRFDIIIYLYRATFIF